MNGDLIGAVVRLLVALPLILGIAYLVLKYGLARRYVVTTGNRRMKLVEQLPLGPKTSLSLVSLGGKYYLLAHQDNSVSLVKELDELKEPEETIVGDIVELTPRTIEEFDRLQKPVGAGVTGDLFDVFKEKCRPRLNKFKNFLLAKLAARKSSGE
ncbi:Flagellar biosynthesis protein, FliO [Pelotomaculum schinkii]|uniref:Flagellar protein n=1 Tax=Pelotomaculum schinkii TaxID=78350 RepID=A0A4Y7R7K2_9FIRM|nr:flagellar biosynthetic protein FliO [Pelotomaculum schinkii]TEB04944.1 Flagellar biosynthesis protein, FliO [Pelotomaculum schinkii]